MRDTVTAPGLALGFEKIGINKAKLRGIPGYYLYPANYHPLYAKNLKSTSTSVVMLQVNGKPVITKNFHPRELNAQNKLFKKSLIQASQGTSLVPKEVNVPGRDPSKNQGFSLLYSRDRRDIRITENIATFWIRFPRVS